MGIDKSTVRFVAHWGCPSSIESYYQESGRAGRDGKQSYARIFYSEEERDTLEFILNKHDKTKPKDSKAARIASFKLMVRYCESIENCRHMMISKFFLDPTPLCVDGCDICKDKSGADSRLREFMHKTPSRTGEEDNRAKRAFRTLINQKFSKY